MKKTYMIPTLGVVEIKYVHQLLAGSAARFDNSGGGEIDLVDDDPDAGEALGRSFDW